MVQYSYPTTPGAPICMASMRTPARASSLAAFAFSCLAATVVSCPDATWNSSQFGCLRITPEMHRHYECIDVCGPDATLACIVSTEMNDFVADLVSRTPLTLSSGATGVGAWLGNYRREMRETTNATDADGERDVRSTDMAASCRAGDDGANCQPDPSEAASIGWDACVSGEVSSFVPTNETWEEGEGRVTTAEDCATLQMTSLKWEDKSCYMSYRHCLCEHGSSASPEYHAFEDAYMSRVSMWAAIIFGGIIPGLSLLPLLPLALCWFVRRRNVAPDASGMTTEARLAAAERAAASLRDRVKITTRLVAWAGVVLFFAPIAAWMASIEIEIIAGAFSNYFVGAPLGMTAYMLSLRPIDTKAIDIACSVFFAIFCLLVAMLSFILFQAVLWWGGAAAFSSFSAYLFIFQIAFQIVAAGLLAPRSSATVAAAARR